MIEKSKLRQKLANAFHLWSHHEDPEPIYHGMSCLPPILNLSNRVYNSLLICWDLVLKRLQFAKDNIFRPCLLFPAFPHFCPQPPLPSASTLPFSSLPSPYSPDPCTGWAQSEQLTLSWGSPQHRKTGTTPCVSLPSSLGGTKGCTSQGCFNIVSSLS